ncbi:hypothetical protein GGR57DRAFT_515282 [Xylariaceae sp. FL1272]|nr:hypothetical protein GGR57DRAFT_515282 [Xylariaceae sp. FL1272]
MAAMTPPPEFLAVLLQHGSFIKDSDTGGTTFLNNGKPVFLLPPPGAMLEVAPSQKAHETWPVRDPSPDKRDNSIVFLSVSVNTDCKDKNVVTEIGYTVYDTYAITHGVKQDEFRKNAETGGRPPGPRGENIYVYATTCHAIVYESGYHHPKTCKDTKHTAQPYHFAFRKSELVKAALVQAKLLNLFQHAACSGLTKAEILQGKRRPVVLLSWNGELHDVIKRTDWHLNDRMWAHWDVRQHPLIQKRYELTSGRYISLEEALDGFGIAHKVRGMEIFNNAGNRSAFLVRLLITLCFLTTEDLERVRRGANLIAAETIYGAESVLARYNVPPGAKAEPDENGQMSYWNYKM